MSAFEYVIDNNPSTSDDKVIRDGILDFNSRFINEKATHFSVFAKNNSQVIGGALIWEHSDALYIDVLWCNENYRRQGIGTQIINMIMIWRRIKNYLKYLSIPMPSKPKRFIKSTDFIV